MSGKLFGGGSKRWAGRISSVNLRIDTPEKTALILRVRKVTNQPTIGDRCNHKKGNIMRSAELRKSNETALQKRIRHCQVTCHLAMDLIAHCQDDEAMARAIGERVQTGVLWAYTGRHGDLPNDERAALQQRLITTQLVAYLCANADGLEDAREMSEMLLKAIDWAWGWVQGHELRLVR